MPINQEIWKIDSEIRPILETEFSKETSLEDILQGNIEILNNNWLIVGRQVKTKFNKYIDLLAIDIASSIIIIELKRFKTPRDVVAQGVDYASWVKNLTSDEVSKIFEDFSDKYLKKDISLDSAFYGKFKRKLEEDIVNSSHQIVIVATKLDTSTERIVNYLSDSKIPINVVFFKVFQENDMKFISRAWMIDPYQTSDIASIQKTEEPWNGEFYISFGHSEERDWDDAKKLGFISAGGGTWYTRTLNSLNPEDRIWVNIPGEGYVGVGKVINNAKKADEVIFVKDGKKGTVYDLDTKGDYYSDSIDNEDEAEYIVKVKWIKTVNRNLAISEVGFFGNQNTVCRPTTPKWTHTVSRLKEIWNIK